MCGVLKLNYWFLSRGKHRGNSIERYHQFLNKNQVIIGNNQGNHTVILQNSKTIQYVWNSAPINNIDITRSMIGIGREFRFPLDIKLSQLPVLDNETNNTLFSYLRNVFPDSVFTLSILQIFISDGRANHQAIHNRIKLHAI